MVGVPFIVFDVGGVLEMLDPVLDASLIIGSPNLDDLTHKIEGNSIAIASAGPPGVVVIVIFNVVVVVNCFVTVTFVTLLSLLPLVWQGLRRGAFERVSFWVKGRGRQGNSGVQRINFEREGC
jgi:hypothetical protein